MNSSNDIRVWYNQFSDNQVITGVNLRHFKIVNRLISLGLKKHHSVLEIGCGIGTLTQLIHQFLKNGKLLATDISDQSIAIAKSRIPRSEKIEFVVTDMSDFRSSMKFDFIVFPDVLEHIPEELHENIFRTVSKMMHADSKILINIPHPRIIDYIRRTEPNKLQVIDQSITALSLVKSASISDLEVINYNSYSLFKVEHDSVFVELKKGSDINYITRSKRKIILTKFKERIKFFFSKL